MVTITVSEKGGQQSTFEFSKPEITIGRMKGNDIVLPKGNVSKRHSKIIFGEPDFTISDMGSTNGTYVNGRKIAGEQPISDSDKIYIGDFILQVEPAMQVGPPPPAPPPPAPNPPPAPAPIEVAPPVEEYVPPPAPPAPMPAPAPAPPVAPQAEVPRLQSGWQPTAQEDATVDRPAERLASKGGYSAPSAVLVMEELESEFDAAFHAAQYDVARVLFETISPQDLPFHYPPTPEDQARFLQAVNSAIDTVNPNVDRDELSSLLVAECVGLGPLEFSLDHAETRDIYINRFDRIIVRRDGRLIVAQRAFSHPQFLVAAAYRLLGPREVEVLTDTIRFGDGTKVHVILPPLSAEGPAITVRKPPTHHPSLDDMAQTGTLSPGMVEFLRKATLAGRSILVAGPTSSGKSTLLSGLVSQLPEATRVVSIEDHAHLQLPSNSVRLETSMASGYDSRFLVQSALSMHPQRIIVDECRGAEGYDWVTAAACGTEGSMATIHGTSATDALGRLESLCLLGSRDLSPRGIREQIARAVNIVVVVNKTPQGFRVQQIAEVQGVDLDAFRLNDIFYYRVEGSGGAFHPTGYIPLFYEDMRNAGVDVDFGIFRE